MSRAVLCLLALVFSAATAEPQTVSLIAPQPAPLSPGIGAGPAHDRPTKRATATLRGRVFAGDTGQPLRRAEVRIVADEVRENRMTMTDAEGRYEFREVPASRYSITAQKGRSEERRVGNG